MKIDLLYLQTVGSTNQYLKEQDLPLGTAVYTQNQTAGRGRMGRSWMADSGGVALSVLVPAQSAALPLVCSIAAARALERLCGQKMQIKWPNDIICGGRKLCGILCESTGQKAIAGFGVNLTQTAEELAQMGLPFATSAKMLGGAIPTARAVAQAIVTEVFTLLPGGFAPLRAEYTRRSATLGRQVSVLHGQEKQIGTALEVTDSGSLLVDFAGTKTEVFAGEVSVRGIYGEALV